MKFWPSQIQHDTLREWHCGINDQTCGGYCKVPQQNSENGTQWYSPPYQIQLGLCWPLYMPRFKIKYHQCGGFCEGTYHIFHIIATYVSLGFMKVNFGGITITIYGFLSYPTWLLCSPW